MRCCWLAIAAITFAIPSALAETFTDDAGRTVEIEGPVGHAVVMNRYNVEIVRALAGSDRIVGIDEVTARDSAYWPEFDETRVVGHQFEPNYELIVALDPDVLILPRNAPYEAATRQLEPFGIPVLVVTSWDMEIYLESIDVVGRLFGVEERAAELEAFHLDTLAIIQERLEGVTPRRVYFEEVEANRTVLETSGWHDMITWAGGTNIFGHVDIADRPAERGSENNHLIDPEGILLGDPEVIVKLQPASYLPQPQESLAEVMRATLARPEIAGTTAAETGEIHLINYLLAGGSSKATGALQLAKWLHPERFEDVDPDSYMRIWMEEFQGLPYLGGMTFGRADLEAGR